MGSLSLNGVILRPQSCENVHDEIFQAISPEVDYGSYGSVLPMPL